MPITGVGKLANPGDTSLESVNAFNQRTGVPATEQVWIENGPQGIGRPGPDRDCADGVTNEDRPPRYLGDAPNTRKQRIDTGWTTSENRETVPEEG